jgi:ATP-dependent RNA helicase DeaD
MTIPSPADVSAHRIQKLLGKVPARVEAGRLELYREAVAVTLAQQPDLDIEDLVAAVAALAVGDEGPQARPAEGDDLDDALQRARVGAKRAERSDRPERSENRNGPRGGSARRTENGTMYRVAVGHKDGAQPGAIVGALTNEGGLTGKDLGKIDIFPSFSLVEIAAELTPEAFDRIGRARVAGRPLRIRLDEGPGPRHTGASRVGHAPAGVHREHRGPGAADRSPRQHRPAAY